VESSVRGRKGKSVKDRSREVQWKWKLLYNIDKYIIVSTTQTHYKGVTLVF
jgi:hypothetical protein